jgi:hypothetical protein
MLKLFKRFVVPFCRNLQDQTKLHIKQGSQKCNKKPSQLMFIPQNENQDLCL